MSKKTKKISIDKKKVSNLYHHILDSDDMIFVVLDDKAEDGCVAYDNPDFTQQAPTGDLGHTVLSIDVENEDGPYTIHLTELDFSNAEVVENSITFNKEFVITLNDITPHLIS